ncbi:phosphoribosylanthranilate isomerase [Enterococcus sp. BWB1-3]|uniref:phosphoribosylanthranilate isomerase n=1 Tax=Enterococcus sp. BWB1-3 TaxID=2787713 RepID=UPI0019224E69|nr:phosphoribosylanthranilate isomerase [Enterococcus sp. BWB1-3]MBL1228312.1 phosphoribosylanthranilate isomerase [Enterococcus sp. BWB1-3]
MKVKICGLKTKEAVMAAVDGGADYIGFVFAESKRRVSAEQVRQITMDVPHTVRKVGVFVSPKIEEVEETIKTAGLDIVQIHGEYPEGTFSVPCILAGSVGRQTEPQIFEQMCRGDYLLFDAPVKQYAGGNGETFNWEELDLALFSDKKVFIAGGLTSENVQQAKAYFSPYAVDVSSGVEKDGEKDIAKIREFLKKAKEDTPCINNR